MSNILICLKVLLPYLFWGILFIGLSLMIVYSIFQNGHIKDRKQKWFKWSRDQKNSYFD